MVWGSGGGGLYNLHGGGGDLYNLNGGGGSLYNLNGGLKLALWSFQVGGPIVAVLTTRPK